MSAQVEEGAAARVATKPLRRLSDVATQRLLEALQLSEEAEAHLLRCLLCQCALRLCKEGTALVAVARASRALARRHVGARA